jgi:hypothetical protein
MSQDDDLQDGISFQEFSHVHVSGGVLDVLYFRCGFHFYCCQLLSGSFRCSLAWFNSVTFEWSFGIGTFSSTDLYLAVHSVSCALHFMTSHGYSFEWASLSMKRWLRFSERPNPTHRRGGRLLNCQHRSRYTDRRGTLKCTSHMGTLEISGQCNVICFRNRMCNTNFSRCLGLQDVKHLKDIRDTAGVAWNSTTFVFEKDAQSILQWIHSLCNQFRFSCNMSVAQCLHIWCWTFFFAVFDLGYCYTLFSATFSFGDLIQSLEILTTLPT